MNQLQTFGKSRAQVVITWGMLYGEDPSEGEFIDYIRQLPLYQVLRPLIALLQFCDVTEPPAYRELDGRIRQLFPFVTASRIAGQLSQGHPWIFFSQWQLLLAIKLVCTFACRDTDQVQVTNRQLLKLLLMTNDFYPTAESARDTTEDLIEGLRSTTLRGYSLIKGEHPESLIGRYAELFDQFAASENQSTFNTWVDIRQVLTKDPGIRLEAFKAVLFALYSSTVPQGDEAILTQLGHLNPDTYFAQTQLTQEELKPIVKLVTTSPEEVRDEHLSKYSDGIGNPVDLGILLRKPVIELIDGSISGISGQLLIQRYTCGLYWDIHDTLPNNRNIEPNRKMFTTFFGELHERYGRKTLQRIEHEQVRAGRQVRLLLEEDYLSTEGSNPDSLLIETNGGSNTRCTLFEFKVGRPRYMDSIVQGDVQSFEEDLSRKIEQGLNQEIKFSHQVMNGERTVPGLLPQNVTAWLFVIVVTDPFPSMGMFLDPLRTVLVGSTNLGNAKRYGPLIMSLKELEQLETIPKNRVSEVLINWHASTYRDSPFNTYYVEHTDRQAIPNRHISALAENEFDAMKTFFGFQGSQ